MSVLKVKLDNFSRRLKREGQSLAVFREGFEIFALHGARNNLQRILGKAAERGNPNAKHWRHLLTQLKKIGMRAPQEAPAAISPGPKGKRSKARSLLPEAPEELQELKEKIEADAVEALTGKIRKLATQRALLSNKLQDPQEDKSLQEQNCRILDEMLPIIEELSELEQQRAKIQIQGLRPEELQEGPVFVIERKLEKYTLEELQGLSLLELKKLKNRLSNDKANYKLSIQTVKTEKTRKKNELKLARAEQDIELLQGIIDEKMRA